MIFSWIWCVAVLDAYPLEENWPIFQIYKNAGFQFQCCGFGYLDCWLLASYWGSREKMVRQLEFPEMLHTSRSALFQHFLPQPQIRYNIFNNEISSELFTIVSQENSYNARAKIYP